MYISVSDQFSEGNKAFLETHGAFHAIHTGMKTLYNRHVQLQKQATTNKQAKYRLCALKI